MNIKYFNSVKSKILFNLVDDKINKFIPYISNNFAEDVKKFSNFWENCYKLIENNKKLVRSEKRSLINLSSVSKKIFLLSYSDYIYNKITSNYKNFMRIEDLVYEVNKITPFLTPSKHQISLEQKKSLSHKKGIEIDQGIFLSSVLANTKSGTHLCEAMLRPSNLALQNLENFNKTGFVDFGKAYLKKKEKYIEVVLDNPEYLNAEDESTLYPLEAAIDIALLSNDRNICVLRGSKVKHKKYKNKKVFGSGINLTHLYEGKISFMWYLVREMGAVHKVFRGIHNSSKSVNNIFFPNIEKLWIGAVETFAIGGACQYLLVLDHIIAEKKAFMLLPARKEGIIPGAANLRLWRFLGDRPSRQAIQNGLKIKANDKNGKKICDTIVSAETLDEALSIVIRSYNNSGVIGATFNRRALRFSQETLDQFREYIAYYSHDQANCHLSDELVRNLKKYWKNR